MKKIYKDIAVFVGGTLFGSAGIKLLSSKDAKNVYTHAAAAVLRMKDTVMNTVDALRRTPATSSLPQRRSTRSALLRQRLLLLRMQTLRLS